MDVQVVFSHVSFFASPFNLLMTQNKGNNLDRLLEYFDNFLLADTC